MANTLQDFPLTLHKNYLSKLKMKNSFIRSNWPGTTQAKINSSVSLFQSEPFYIMPGNFHISQLALSTTWKYMILLARIISWSFWTLGYFLINRHQTTKTWMKLRHEVISFHILKIKYLFQKSKWQDDKLSYHFKKKNRFLKTISHFHFNILMFHLTSPWKK